MDMKNLSVEQRLQRAFVQVSRHPDYCLVSGVMLCGKSTVHDTGIPTACTDGWNVQYGRAFMDKLSEPEFNFVVLHETYHKAFRQMTVWDALWKQDARRANKAADFVINQLIVDADPSGAFASPPEGARLDPQYRGMNTKEVFDALNGRGDGKKGEKGEKGEKGDAEGGAGLDEHKWGEGEGEGEGDERGRAIDRALRQGKEVQKRIGKGKGRGNTALDELLAPTVNWREQLREFVQSVVAGKDISTWRRPARRGMARDMYLPSSYSESVGEIVVAIDTSGSVSGAELRAMVSEMVGICESVVPDKVHLIWWGTEVVGEQVFKPGEYEDMAQALKPKNGGGTDLACVFNWVQEKRLNPACIIVLTDGAWRTPSNIPSCPVLFGMTTDTVSPFGVTIKVEV